MRLESSPNRRRWTTAMSLTLLVGAAVATSTVPAWAGRFLAVLESETFAVGEGEVVQAGDWCRHRTSTSDVQAVTLQLGAEYGLAERLQLGIALPAYSTLRGADVRETEFGGTSLWGVYNHLSPAAGAVGLSTVVAVTDYADDISLEVGAIVDVAIGPTVAALNLAAIQAWASDRFADDQVVLAGRLGFSRRLSAALSVAAEAEWRFAQSDGWRYASDEILVGPALLWETNAIWLLGGMLFDLQPESAMKQAAMQLQIGVPF